MLNEINLKKIVPKGDRILVDIYIPPNITDSGVLIPDNVDMFTSTKMDIKNYIGTVIAIGDKKEIASISPGLSVGDNVLFSQFAGYHVPVKKGKFAKIVHAQDIHSKIKKNMKFGTDDVSPTSDRLVVKIILEGEYMGDGTRKLDSGVIVSEEAMAAHDNPSEVDTQKAKVLAVGPLAKDYKVGDIVFIPTYVGNEVVSKSGDILKTINYNDVLFKVIN